MFQAMQLADRIRRRLERLLKTTGYVQAVLWPTYANRSAGNGLGSYMSGFEWPDSDRIAIGGVSKARRIRDHEFNLLGSGWVRVRYGMECRGLEGYRYSGSPAVSTDPEGRWLEGRINRSNFSESRRIWSMIDGTYDPIDWQLDFKSGFRWSEKQWSYLIPFSGPPGADIKVPWELARFQHASWLSAVPAPDLPASSREFRNQVLDFISTNPPGFGVNWCCTMDVAIRAANLLVAFDLFRSRGILFDPDFEKVFERSVVEHGRHIVDHLEWSTVLNGNHYLANIAGLVFVAAYVSRSEEADAWLAFSIQQLIEEVSRQFNADGSNFEGSVSYHRLSSEIVLFATAIVAGLPPEKRAVLESLSSRSWKGHPGTSAAPVAMFAVPGSSRTTPFPSWYWEKLERIAEFTLHMTKPDGLVAQFGDNDSGRFFKLDEPCPTFNKSNQPASEKTGAIHFRETDLDHRHLVSGINALFGRKDFNIAEAEDTGHHVVRRLAAELQVESFRQRQAISVAPTPSVGSPGDWESLWKRFETLPESSRQENVFSSGKPHLDRGLELHAYPDFGVYLIRSSRLFLGFRCGSFGQSGIGGHAHLDQLALEIMIDGIAMMRDPGTYLYTPLPDQRNAYRSAQAHFVPHVSNREPGDLSRNLFRIDRTSPGECLYFGKRGFAGRHFGYGEAVYRLILIESQQVVVRDFADQAMPLASSAPRSLPFSPAYGRQLLSESD